MRSSLLQLASLIIPHTDAESTKDRSLCLRRARCGHQLLRPAASWQQEVGHITHKPFRHLHLDGLAGRVDYAQLLNDASEITMLAIDPQQQAQNTTMGGLPPGTLTLELPVQKPPVVVPGVELVFKGGHPLGRG